MKFNPSTPWAKNYAARFGYMANNRSEAIELALYDAIKASTAEIDAAVASLCQSWNMETHPGIMHIAERIESMRGVERRTKNKVTFYQGSATHETNAQETTMADLKQLLKYCREPIEAWNIICTPMDTGQCRELRDYCDKHKIQYQRFVPAVPIQRHRIFSPEAMTA